MINRDKPVKLSKDENSKDRKKYGVSNRDVWYFNDYLAQVISNGLRMLAMEIDKWPTFPCSDTHPTVESWKADVLLNAMKLDFYASDIDSIVQSHIDFSNDSKNSLEWVNGKGTERFPGMNEYVEKTQITEEVQEQFKNEALAWLIKYWDSLWN